MRGKEAHNQGMRHGSKHGLNNSILSPYLIFYHSIANTNADQHAISHYPSKRISAEELEVPRFLSLWYLVYWATINRKVPIAYPLYCCGCKYFTAYGPEPLRGLQSLQKFRESAWAMQYQVMISARPNIWYDAPNVSP